MTTVTDRRQEHYPSKMQNAVTNANSLGAEADIEWDVRRSKDLRVNLNIWCQIFGLKT